MVENANKELFSMLSLHDPNFFAHLDETVNNYNKLHDKTANMWVETVYDGLPAPLIGHFNPRTFKPNDYDEKPGKEQHAGQTSLGRQSLMQFSVIFMNQQEILKLTGLLLLFLIQDLFFLQLQMDKLLDRCSLTPASMSASMLKTAVP